MASSAIDEAMAAMEAVVSNPPPGVILPPKEIRELVERTAGYVIRNGQSFEDMVRTKNADIPKFSFAFTGDAYNAFYEWRKDEIRNGRGTDVAAGRVGEGVAVKPVKKGPEPPPEFQFSARMPNVNANDLEVVKLTALFVAKNGRSWMTQLSQREAGNFQFDFLRPQHSLHQYFTRLIDQYQLLLSGSTVEGRKAEKLRIEEIKTNIANRFNVLERAKLRAEWIKYQETQKAKKEEQDEAEKREFAQIDWHDFSIVGEIIFSDEDEHIQLPPPTSLNDLQSASLEQKGSYKLRIEEAIPEATSYYNDPAPPMPPPQFLPQQPVFPQQSTFPQQPAYPQQPLYPQQPSYPQQPTYPQQSSYPQQPSFPQQPSYPQQPLFQQQPTVPQMPTRTAQEEEEEVRIQERQAERERAAQAMAAARPAPGPVRIVAAGAAPRTTARRRNVQMAQCPNCKSQIPFDELEQHMKIELLDPRWREQKAKEQQRASTTNLSTQDVANNLKRLASQRTDVFDPLTGLSISKEEDERRKRAAVSYDGNPVTANAALGQGMTVEDQIRLIHQKAAQGH